MLEDNELSGKVLGQKFTEKQKLKQSELRKRRAKLKKLPIFTKHQLK
jgi:hypothetical protein